MNLELKNDDFKKEVLTAEDWYERVTEQIKWDLWNLHESILKDFNDDADKKSDVIVDIEPAKKFLERLKDKKFSEIQAEWASWAFAVQLLLKDLKDPKTKEPFYKWDVDGLYGWSGGLTSIAVKAFQKSVWFTGEDVDGWAGWDTIKKLLWDVSNHSIDETGADSNNTSTEVEDPKVDTDKIDDKIKINESKIITKLDLKKWWSYGEIDVYKREWHTWVYIFDKWVLKYYDWKTQKEYTWEWKRSSKSIIDLKIIYIYESMKKLNSSTKLITIANLKKNIEKNRDDWDDDNTFENIWINWEKPLTSDLNKAKIWNEILENNYDFDWFGDDEDDARKDFVEFVWDLGLNQNIKINKIKKLKIILDKIDVPLDDLNKILDFKLVDILSNKEIRNNVIGKVWWLDVGDISSFINNNWLREDKRTIWKYLIDNIT